MTDPFAALRLDGRVVVVTGATQGLGAAIARHVAELGADGVVVCGRDARRGEAVAASLDCDAVFVAADLASPDVGTVVAGVARERFGRVDGLVNAGGLSTRGTLADTTVALWDELFAINARAPFLLVQALAPLMRDGGSVVNVISMAAHGGEPVLMAYAASKGALVTLTRNLGNALTARRIRVNGLNIGWTATDGEHVVQTANGAGEDWLAAADAAAALGRLLRPEDIAPMVTHLLSDASAMVTGSVVDFDQTVLGVPA